jgi:hypothetical protein
MDLLFHYLVIDGYIAPMPGFQPAMFMNYSGRDAAGKELKIDIPSQAAFMLTESGKEFVRKWQEAKPLEETSE